MEFKIKKEILCKLIWECESSERQQKIEYIIKTLRLSDTYTQDEILLIKDKFLNSFYPYYFSKWQGTSRHKKTFQKKYKEYLNEEFVIDFRNPEESQNEEICPMEVDGAYGNEPLQIHDVEMQEDSVLQSRGRPVVAYEKASKKTKKRRAIELAGDHCSQELGQALKKRKTCYFANQLDPCDMKSYMHMSKVLAMYMDLKYTAGKYQISKSHHKDITGGDPFPSYKKIIIAKRESYPREIYVTEDGAETNLFFLLENTVKKILLLKNEEERVRLCKTNLHLEGKWGMDGASGQQNTRQKWSTENNTGANVATDADSDMEDDGENDTLFPAETDDIYGQDLPIFDEEGEDCNLNDVPITNMSDKNVFGINFVPLQLKSNGSVIWKNDKPSSIFYCRPIKFKFTKEEKSFVKNQYKYYTDLLQKVQAWNFKIGKNEFIVTFDLKCTMIDGKICNWLTDQYSTKSCNICRVNPSKINDLKFVKSLVSQESYYKFGLSTLHAWIKFLEYVLHVSYKLGIRKEDSKAEKKLKIANRKSEVQKLLKEKMQLTVDVVKQGFGTTNTGNIIFNFNTLLHKIN